MNKILTAIVFSTLASAALGAAAQAPGYGPGYGPGPGYGQGPWAGNPTDCPRGLAVTPGPRNVPATGGDPVASRLDRLGARLGLSEEQKARLEPILQERQRMREANREAMRNQVSQILTPEQLAQFDQMRARRGKGRRAGGQGYRRGAGLGTAY